MQHWIERTAWILLAGLLFWMWNTADRDAQDLVHVLEEQHAAMERQTAQLDSLAMMLQPAQDDADAELKRDLMSKPALINVPGVLGGTMRIVSESNVRILDDGWVYAEFEDGHIQAAGLFSYTRRSDGRIVWKLIESRIF